MLNVENCFFFSTTDLASNFWVRMRSFFHLQHIYIFAETLIVHKTNCRSSESLKYIIMQFRNATNKWFQFFSRFFKSKVNRLKEPGLAKSLHLSNLGRRRLNFWFNWCKWKLINNFSFSYLKHNGSATAEASPNGLTFTAFFFFKTFNFNM